MMAALLMTVATFAMILSIALAAGIGAIFEEKKSVSGFAVLAVLFLSLSALAIAYLSGRA